jgi:osmotically-inducible protein OsmY
MPPALRPLIIGLNPSKGADVTNDELTALVADELSFDPKVKSDEIAVTADGGQVTLRGTVGTFHEKREAGKAAQRVYGVSSVQNDLDVRLMTGHKREDAALRADVLQALMLDSLVPSTIDAKVDDGWVTLTGKAEWNYQRDEAERVAGNVAGVVVVDTDIELTGEKPNAEHVKHAIKDAIKRNAKLDAEGITVETSEHTVTLKGTVASWAEHDDAVAAAWDAPGVQKVKDHILVAY